jgi:hypothetical protein
VNRNQERFPQIDQKKLLEADTSSKANDLTRTSGLRLLCGPLRAQMERRSKGFDGTAAKGENEMALNVIIEAALRMARAFSGKNLIQIGAASGLRADEVRLFEIGEVRLGANDLTNLARAVRVAVEGRCQRLRRLRLRVRDKQSKAIARLLETRA